jgi:hypothetical protein
VTNKPNQWVKGKKKELIKELYGGECYVRGCHETRNLELSHIRQTPLSRTGSRDRKMVVADVRKHPTSYVACCQEHKHDPRTKVYQHDRRMAKLGRR